MAYSYAANGSVYDDFRPIATTTVINTRTSDSGHTWGYRGASPANWTIQAGTAWPTGDPADGNVAGATTGRHQVIGIDFGSANVDVEVTLERPISSVLGAGLMVRRTADLDSAYAVAVTSGSAGVYRMTGMNNVFLEPVLTTLATYNGLSPADLSVLRVVTSGNDITTYLDGVQLGTVTDSTYTGTVHGMYQDFGGSTNSWRFYAFNMHPVRNRLVCGWMTLN